MVATANRDPLCIPTSYFQLFCAVAVCSFSTKHCSPDESLAEWPRMKGLPCEFEWGCQRMQRLVTEITDEAKASSAKYYNIYALEKKSQINLVFIMDS